MSQILCLTGMHRSGTSLIASWIKACGVIIDNGNAIGSGIGNPLGHFEDRDFVNLHGEILKKVAPESQGWKYFRADSIAFQQADIQRAQKMVGIRNRVYPLWGWKDPRTIFFLRQWKNIISDLKVVSIWRPVNEVIHSLLSRSKEASEKIYKINIKDSIKMWIISNSLLCNYKAEYPKDTLIVPLESFITDCIQVYHLITNKLKISMEYVPFDRVYQPHLLNKTENVSLHRTLLDTIEIMNLEKRLITLSDNTISDQSA